MAVVIVLQNEATGDGFTFSEVIPGCYSLAAETGPEVQIPEGMPCDLSAPVRWIAAVLFGEGQDPPRWHMGWTDGCLAAFGFEFEDASSHTWGVLSLTHLRRERDQLLFDSVLDPPDSPTSWTACVQAKELLADLISPFAELGWRVHEAVQGMVLLSSSLDCQADLVPFNRIHGQSLQLVLPRGEGAGMILELLMTGQLLLARAEGNRYRSVQGLKPLNTPWIHGVGRGNDSWVVNQKVGRFGTYWCSDPVVAGLARRAGWTRLPWEAAKDDTGTAVMEQCNSLVELALGGAMTAPVLLQFAISSPRGLARIGQEIITPLAQSLGKEDRSLLLVTAETFGPEGQRPDQPVYWGYGRGRQLLAKKRFWRQRHWGEGCTLTLNRSRELWQS
ncbi:MAG: hypothetical protein HQL73_05280 [Magnetococcales bacterium]|nr:hypothetical protein [Magnetococcales bacterium]